MLKPRNALVVFCKCTCDWWYVNAYIRPQFFKNKFKLLSGNTANCLSFASTQGLSCRQAVFLFHFTT